VNWEHLKAFVWLRWRLAANGWQRGGKLNAALMLILAVALIVLAVPLFFASLAVGLFAFADATPTHLLYAWDGMTAGFLVFWTAGLMAELQRTDVLSPAKLLHLPLSAGGVFVINFVSSLATASLIFFAAIMFGFGLGVAFAQGYRLLVAWPLTLALFLMVAALTCQFQGWLATLSANPRRRRTMVVAITMIFVLIFQLPNLLTHYGPWDLHQQSGALEKLMQDMQELRDELTAGHLQPDDFKRRQQKLNEDFEAITRQKSVPGSASLQQNARLLNLVLPVGWPALGVATAAEGNLLPALFGFFGLTLITGVSLHRAYRTTLRLYQGDLNSRAPRRAAAAPVSVAGNPGRRPLLAWRIPGASEPVSAIALCGLRSLTRAPEAKMMLLTPVFFGAIFGSSIMRVPADAASVMRPLAAIGAISLALFGMLQLMANQFGFDRDGFRVFVLSAASRRDILLGKNLSFAPLALLMTVIPLTVVEVMRPLRIEHLLSMAPQFVSMYLMFCLMTNLISILAPMPIAVGSLKPANPKFLTVLLQMVLFLVLFPLAQLPTMLPLGIERGLEWQGVGVGLPICLVLSTAECLLIVVVYRLALNWQGRLLSDHEQQILETVTGRAA
jgi:ABC-2 type transport system permease protein